MRVALIGSRGQLGTDLVATAPGEVDLIPLTSSDIDITDMESVRAVLMKARPGVVINAAAYVRVDDAEDDVELAFRVNALGVKNVAEACAEEGAVFVQMSTDYVFDGVRGQTPYVEDDTPNPINVYGISKLAGEFFAANYCRRHFIVRSASLYGKAGARGKGGNFVYTILRKARQGEPLRVVSDIVMSPTPTRDLAVAMWDLIRSDSPYGTYHLAAAGHCSWYDFACEILHISGLKVDIAPISQAEFPSKAKRPPWSALATAKGIHLRRWEVGLRDFLREAGCIS